LEAVNNDGELAIDLADGADMENLLSDAMETQGACDRMFSFCTDIYIAAGSL